MQAISCLLAKYMLDMFPYSPIDSSALLYRQFTTSRSPCLHFNNCAVDQPLLSPIDRLMDVPHLTAVDEAGEASSTGPRLV